MNSLCTTSKYTLLLTTALLSVTFSVLFLLEQRWVNTKTLLGSSFWTCRPAFQLTYSLSRKIIIQLTLLRGLSSSFLTFSGIWMKQYSQFDLVVPQTVFSDELLPQMVNFSHYSLVLISSTVRDLPFQVLTIPYGATSLPVIIIMMFIVFIIIMIKEGFFWCQSGMIILKLS